MRPHELKLFRAGDGRIFAALVSPLEAMLRRQIAPYARGDRDEADDMFEDVCIKIFDQRRNFRGDGPLAAWASRLCTRFCVDHSRKETRAQHLFPLMDGPFDAAADPRSTPDRIRSAEESEARFEAVTDAVVALPPRKRLIAILHWYRERTAGEIALELHLTASTVWTTLSQIRATLRIALAPVARPPSQTPI